MTAASVILRVLIRAYQILLAPLSLGSCRFEPSCSQYAHDAIAAHGVPTGIRLAVRRVLRCHPWGGAGYDPVPPNADCAGHRTQGAGIR